MKKILALMVFAAIALFMLWSNPTWAQDVSWDICAMDVKYVTQYQFSRDANNVIRGQAFASGPNFPAPITGSYNPTANTWSFSIGYLEANATRHYRVKSNGLGHSWAILEDSSVYDQVRTAKLVRCPSQASDAVQGTLGAPE